MFCYVVSEYCRPYFYIHPPAFYTCSLLQPLDEMEGELLETGGSGLDNVIKSSDSLKTLLETANEETGSPMALNSSE